MSHSTCCRWLPAIALIATPVGAQPVIAWSPDRPLTWNDFHGSVRSGADEQQAAETMSSISWTYRYELQWSPSDCSFTVADVESIAEFHPDGSWVRPGHETDAILHHEQLHFDISQLYRQRFAARVAPLVGESHSCQGRNARSAARYAENEIRDLIGSIYEDIWQSHLNDQATYDRETRHGIDTTAQATWAQKIDDALRETP